MNASSEDNHTYTSTLDIMKALCMYGLNNANITKFCQQFHHKTKQHEWTEKDISSTVQIFITALYCIVIFVSLSGNVLVVLTFLFNKSMRSTTNVFIFSLSISDLLMTFTSMPFGIWAVWSISWVFGAYGCKIVPFLMSVAVSSSSITMCFIAIERYMAILHPVKTTNLRTMSKAYAAVAGIWLVSILLSSPNAIFYKEVPLKTATGTSYYCLWPTASWSKQLDAVFILVVLLVVPFIFMIAIYTVISCKLWSRASVGTSSSQQVGSNQQRMKKKAVKMMTMVMVLFTFCWAPLLLFNVVKDELNIKAEGNNVTLQYFLMCLAMSSAAYNPIIYAFMNENFRKNFRRFLACKNATTLLIMARSGTSR